jgi:GlpG protein
MSEVADPGRKTEGDAKPKEPSENPQDLWEGPPPPWKSNYRPSLRGKPIASVAVLVLCVLVTLNLTMLLPGQKREWLMGFLADGPFGGLAGRYLSFFTSTVVHIELWHLAFNCLFLFYYGPMLERVIGTWRWLVFYAVAAFITSGAEAAFSGTAGIGGSGVLYAFYGFMWMTKARYREFVSFFSPQMTIMPLAWLVLCIVLTATGTMNIGNAAHVSGLALGVAVAEIFVTKRLRALCWLLVAVLALGAAISPFVDPLVPPGCGMQLTDGRDLMEAAGIETIETAEYDGDYEMDLKAMRKADRLRTPGFSPEQRAAADKGLETLAATFSPLTIRRGVLRYGRIPVGEFRMLSGGRGEDGLFGNALWHEDVHDPGDMQSVFVLLKRAGEELQLTFAAPGQQDAPPPLIYRKRKSR